MNGKIRSRDIEMVSTVHSMGLFGMDAYVVDVECDVGRSLPSFEVVEYNILTTE